MKIERRRLFACVLGISIIPFLLPSCQNISSSTLTSSSAGDTSLFDDANEQIVQVKKPLLMDKWDSLMKKQIVFEVDTLNPVPIKTQRKRLKDSLIAEFNKKPKNIYLTFDDGPLVGSAAIDSIAKARNIKVSAFLVGRHAKMGKGRQRDVERYKANANVGVYNHSFSHGYNKFSLFYSNPMAAVDDFVKNEHDLGLKHKVARLPGRNIWIYDDVRKIDLKNGSSTADLLHSKGYAIYGWDVEWRINSPTGEPIQPLNTVLSRIKSDMNNKSSMVPNNVVLLMHDDMFQTRKGKRYLVELIDSLQKRNYKFELMENYPIKY